MSYRYLYTQVLGSARVASLGVEGRRILINTIKWPLVLLGMTRRAGHNQICVHQIVGVSWKTRLRNINVRHVYGIIRYLQELWWTFYENILPNKLKHLTKTSWRNCVFFLRFSSRHIRGHHYKRLQLNNYEMENAVSFVLVSNTAQIAS